MSYQFITDPGHGWLQVPVIEYMQALDAGCTFTQYSYGNPRTGYVYLEEDRDALVFIDYYKSKMGAPLVYDVTTSDNDSFIRELPRLIATA